MSNTSYIPASEDDIIGNLRRTSPRFNIFFEEEYSKVKCEVSWGQKDDLLGEGDSQTIFDRISNKAIILLKRVPPNPEDDFIVAHELLRLILFANGYPVIDCLDTSEETETMAIALSDLLSSLIIDKKLLDFGFDLNTHYEKIDQKNLERIKTIIPDIDPRGYSIVSILLYANRVLGQEFLDRLKKNALIEFIDERLPTVAKYGQDTVDIVNKVGYDTPDRHFTILKILIDGLSINKKVKV